MTSAYRPRHHDAGDPENHDFGKAGAGTDADAYYFRIVADYIHLHPARAEVSPAGVGASGRRGFRLRTEALSGQCLLAGADPFD